MAESVRSFERCEFRAADFGKVQNDFKQEAKRRISAHSECTSSWRRRGDARAPFIDEWSSSSWWTRTTVRSLIKTRSHLSCALAMSSSNQSSYCIIIMWHSHYARLQHLVRWKDLIISPTWRYSYSLNVQEWLCYIFTWNRSLREPWEWIK